jgi:hypothetical protein
MPKYYVRSGWVRLVLDATSPREAAVRGIQWSRDQQAAVLAEPVGERIREAEILEWQLDDQITVSETGFGGRAGQIFETAAVAAPPSRRVTRQA